VTGRAEIMGSVHVGGLGGTFVGNPVAFAAALGAIRTIEEQDLVSAACHIGEVMLPRLRTLQERHPVVGDVGGGARWSRSNSLSRARRRPTRAAAAEVAKACHAEGLVVLTCGTYGNVLRFLPPLVIPITFCTRACR
jgi:4-aminobutyrate aminotransferase/(S)-3-amino-2-methylpropionate transaminase